MSAVRPSSTAPAFDRIALDHIRAAFGEERAGGFVLLDVIDSIQRDEQGRIRFHYTLIDVAAEAGRGEPTPGDDCAGCTWAPLGALHGYALWQRTVDVITRASGLPRPIG